MFCDLVMMHPQNSSVRRTAILIDGGFFFHRVDFFLRKNKISALSSEQLAQLIWDISLWHIKYEEPARPKELYRIYFYDCPPLDRQVNFPIKPDGYKTTPQKNFKKDTAYQLRQDTHSQLRKKRKTALRMGHLSKHGKWVLNDNSLKDLLDAKKCWPEIKNDDFHYQVTQKGIDIQLGLDIATMAFERLVDNIILIAGDADFVPAAKLARSKGIDFVLDPLWSTISDELNEHIDGLRSPNISSLILRLTQNYPAHAEE